MKIFSFALFGNNKKYCQGLIENLRIINEYYPEYHTFIAIGNTVPYGYLYQIACFNNVHMTYYPFSSMVLANFRFFPIDDPEVELCFVRDSDSRINERDRCAIDEFIRSDKLFHIIRDHRSHTNRILGGTWGCKRGALQVSIRELYEKFTQGLSGERYGHDEDFLSKVIYPLVINNALVHSEYKFYDGEISRKINCTRTNSNFIGNVVDFDKNGNEIQGTSQMATNVTNYLFLGLIIIIIILVLIILFSMLR